MFQDTALFPFLRPLQERWKDILAELTALTRERFADWPEREIYRGDWSVFGLYAFGFKQDENCAACPVTTTCAEAVPGLVSAAFSALTPGTHITPHKGYSGAILRCHLGLVIAEGCAIRVGTETRAWGPGELLVFDDTTEHEAWNRGSSTRIVLLLDFKRDPDSELSLDDLPPWLNPFA